MEVVTEANFQGCLQGELLLNKPEIAMLQDFLGRVSVVCELHPMCVPPREMQNDSSVPTGQARNVEDVAKSKGKKVIQNQMLLRPSRPPSRRLFDLDKRATRNYQPAKRENLYTYNEQSSARGSATANPRSEITATTACTPSTAHLAAAVAKENDIETWRRFSPTKVDPDRCLARVFNNGCGGQCHNRFKSTGSKFCTQHTNMGRWRNFGRVDGPIPIPGLARLLGSWPSGVHRRETNPNKETRRVINKLRRPQEMDQRPLSKQRKRSEATAPQMQCEPGALKSKRALKPEASQPRKLSKQERIALQEKLDGLKPEQIMRTFKLLEEELGLQNQVRSGEVSVDVNSMPPETQHRFLSSVDAEFRKASRGARRAMRSAAA